MRTTIIIALAFLAAPFGFYLYDSARFEPRPIRIAPVEAQPPLATNGPIGQPSQQADSVELADIAAAAPQDCTPETRFGSNADGSATTLLTCATPEEQLRHEYETYPDQALRDLAWADARAAEVLGMRLREEDTTASLGLILRAAALSGGDPGPVLAYSNAYPGPTSIDGIPVRDTVQMRFVLAAVAELLGAGPNLLPYWEMHIRQASSDPRRELRMLRDRARRLVDEMQRIELEVKGTSTFGGQSDA